MDYRSNFSIRKPLLLSLMVLSFVSYSYGQKALPITGFESPGNGLLLHLKPGMMKVQVITPSIIHIVYTPDRSFSKYPKLAVLKKNWGKVSWHSTETDEYLQVATDSIQVRINKKTGAVSYYNNRGEEVLSEPQSGSKQMQPVTVQGEKTYHARQKFDFSPDEALYGLGQYQSKLMNYAGHDVLMSQSNRNDVVPFLVSSKGYGILWNNTSQSWFRDTYQGAFWSDVADQIDYYFVYGPQTDRIISGYRELTGKAPLFGKWVYGYIQSKEHYKTSKELIGIVAEYRRRQIPLDVIVQDWHYWGDNGWNTLTFNKKRYPHPEQMMDTLHDKYHAHLLLSVWPKFGDKTAIYKAMKSHDYLYPVGDGGGDFEYDAFNPDARDLYWKWIDKGLFSKGVDSWWLDATEPEIRDAASTRESTARFILLNKHNYLGTGARYLNAYSLMTTAGVYKHQRETTSKKRVFILTRSAFAGQQRNAAATWSGDTQASWIVLQKQIAAGLNFSLSGIPYWTTDIGAFFVDNGIFPGGSKNKDYRELFVRWFEYGA
ncbi:MAG TPA: TIM-barrel domain-containing protein, partial [Balneolales bacterium]|nr:TIM-barrel domain-containing protein [Balneolales bacterium]